MPEQKLPNESTDSLAELAQLMPFNEYRFDDCIAYLSHRYGHPLSCYEMMKLHVMIDVYHTLETGKPVIGGKFSPFTNGPVSRSSKSRVRQWENNYEKCGMMPDGFQLLETGDRITAKPSRIPDEDDFSQSEISAMDRAWKDVVVLLRERSFEGSQRFFHEEGFIGKAWKKARYHGRNLSWSDIIDAYHAEHPSENRAMVKDILTL